MSKSTIHSASSPNPHDTNQQHGKMAGAKAIVEHIQWSSIPHALWQQLGSCRRQHGYENSKPYERILPNMAQRSIGTMQRLPQRILWYRPPRYNQCAPLEGRGIGTQTNHTDPLHKRIFQKDLGFPPGLRKIPVV